MPRIRVVVVEDFKPFRELICETLAKRLNVRVLCAVSDGPEAVQRTAELKPDLIFLDIGLPTLNGLEAARQIRKLAPKSKIVFVSGESSPDVVQEALGVGAWGFVVKTRVGSDLLAALDAVLEGEHFVSPGLSVPSDPRLYRLNAMQPETH
jgi:DNA-binding NarL/FixJ family response regulator